MSFSRLRDYNQEFAGADQDSGTEEEETATPDLSGVPERGIFPETKQFLLEKLDEEGGIDAINRKNELLQSICDKFPTELGAEGSELRKRVRTCVYHWKRNKELYTRSRKKLSAKQPPVSSVSVQSVSSVRSSAVSSVQSLAPASPPKITIKKSSNMFSPNRKKRKSTAK